MSEKIKMGKFNQTSWHRPVIPATLESEAALVNQDQPRIQSEFKTSLGNLVRPYLKIKYKKCAGNVVHL